MLWRNLKNRLNHKQMGSIYLFALIIFAFLALSLTFMLKTLEQRFNISKNERIRIQATYNMESVLNQFAYDPKKIEKLSSLFKNELMANYREQAQIPTDDLVLIEGCQIQEAILRRGQESDFEVVIKMKTESLLSEGILSFIYPESDTEIDQLNYYWDAVDTNLPPSIQSFYRQSEMHFYEKNNVQKIDIYETVTEKQSEFLETVDSTISILTSGQTTTEIIRENLAETTSEKEDLSQSESENADNVMTEINTEISKDSVSIESETESASEINSQILSDPPLTPSTESLTEEPTGYPVNEPILIDSTTHLILDNKVYLHGIFRLSGNVYIKGKVSLKGLLLARQVNWIFDPGSKLYLSGLAFSDTELDKNKINYQVDLKYTEPYTSFWTPPALPIPINSSIRDL